MGTVVFCQYSLLLILNIERGYEDKSFRPLLCTEWNIHLLLLEGTGVKGLVYDLGFSLFVQGLGFVCMVQTTLSLRGRACYRP